MAETSTQHNKLFIAEFARDVRGLVTYWETNGEHPAEYRVVALQPDAKVACKKNGIPYIDTLPFFQSESHRRVLTKSQELTSAISDKLRFKIEAAVKYVFKYTFIFYSRFYINNYLWIIEVMTGIKRDYGNSTIYLYREETVPAEAQKRDPYFSKTDRFVDVVVEKYCKQNDMKVHVITSSGKTQPEHNETNYPRLMAILKTVARKLFKIKLKRLSRKNPILVVVPSYYLDRVCKDIQAKYPGVPAVTNRPADIPLKGYIKICLKELKNLLTGGTEKKGLSAVPVELFESARKSDEKKISEAITAAYEIFSVQCKELFVYENCSIWEEFNGKVEKDLLGTLVWLHEMYGKQLTFLQHLNPAVVISPVSTGEYQCWGEAAITRAIPTLVIPQKGLLKPSNEFAKLEEYYIGRAQITSSFENAAAQTPLVKQYLTWAGYKGNTIETGNMIFARLTPEKRETKKQELCEKIGGNKKVIVWAPSMKTRKSRRFYVLESIDELLIAMKEVFKTVFAMNDVHLIFRIHPGDAITKREIYDLLDVPHNVTVSDSGTFEDVIATADLLISFSSTAIQEALINYIPILLFDKWKRYNHLDADPVKGEAPEKLAAAYYIDNKEKLPTTLNWILDNHSNGEIPSALFEKYIYLNEKETFDNFLDFIGKCLDK